MIDELAPAIQWEPEPEAPALIQPEPEEAPEPVQVISVDELLDRLTQSALEDRPDSEGEESAPEGENGVSAGGIISADNPLELPMELAPVEVIGMDKLLKQTAEMQQLQTTIQQTLNHPVLTTSFADYTVTEGLLLLLLLFFFLKACADMLSRFCWFSAAQRTSITTSAASSLTPAAPGSWWPIPAFSARGKPSSPSIKWCPAIANMTAKRSGAPAGNRSSLSGSRSSPTWPSPSPMRTSSPWSKLYLPPSATGIMTMRTTPLLLRWYWGMNSVFR